MVLVFQFSHIGSGVLNRRRWELCILSSLQVFGFVFFTVLVVLPFYVMLMTSLKSQQALLMNPLDLMPNWRQEGWAIFRSYIELFRDFNFGRYIGVSAIVSLATVALTLLFAIHGRLRCRSLALRRTQSALPLNPANLSGSSDCTGHSTICDFFPIGPAE